jgi:hypothetical protein
MRTLKIIIILLAALLGVAFILALLGPSRTHVERTITVHASPTTAYGYISKLKNMQEWGVWQRMDRDARYTYTGEDGTLGFVAAWDGDTIKQGSQTIIGLEPDKAVRTELAFGDFMVSQAALTFEGVGDSTRIVWTLDGGVPFLMRPMAFFFNMEEAVGRDFEQGLMNLRPILEQAQQEADLSAYAIQVTERPAMIYVGRRAKVDWGKLKDFYAAGFGEGMQLIGKANVQPIAPPSGVYFEWDEVNRMADLIAGIPVAVSAKKQLKGIAFFEAPASKALLIDYVGGYNGLGKAHAAMDSYMQTNNLEFNGLAIEEYVTDPGLEPDSNKWHTNIIYFVK